jgi:hypothetical protein
MGWVPILNAKVRMYHGYLLDARYQTARSTLRTAFDNMGKYFPVSRKGRVSVQNP